MYLPLAGVENIILSVTRNMWKILKDVNIFLLLSRKYFYCSQWKIIYFPRCHPTSSYLPIKQYLSFQHTSLFSYILSSCLSSILYLQRVHTHTCFITWWLWDILIIEWEMFILGSHIILICFFFLLLPLLLDGIKLLTVDPCWRT